MSGIEGLGDAFNLGFTFDNVYVNLANAHAVSFVCHLTAGDTFTVTEATALAGTGAQVLATVTQYYTTAVAGTSAWTKNTQAAASTVVTTDASVAVFTIRAEELSAGYSHVKVASTSTGTVLALLHGLNQKRTPANLPAVSS